MRAGSGWLQSVLARLPMMQPGSLVVTSEGIGVYMGDWGGSSRVFGVRKGNRTILEMYPPLDD